jgi:hypothetical protein
MTITFADMAAFFVWTAIVSGAGSFLGAYLKRKAESLATKEDLQGLVKQVEATTQATESIKTSLTGSLWESQERWRLKSNLYVTLVRQLQQMINRYDNLHYITANYGQGPARDEAWARWESQNKQPLVLAGEQLEECNAIATIVNPTVGDIISRLWSDTNELGGLAGEIDLRVELYRQALRDIIEESRRDLRVS